MSDPQLFDPWPMDVETEAGDCPARSFGHPPLPHLGAVCVLDTGHAGAHVASDGQKVVCAWQD
ncbi:hypothetical protein BJF83_20765 [Nocardiopsis sp. CNR-923]|uniref:hypothetical protein n=1 Tax=Nocardiopsis sp. CNR-923 TaxID=1904965 RepID=UPI00095E8358|nr:hypothetical protein [Nocardiopsis sp. CNR-923]OLT26598.1 hypothetical protein BJF83_20765 [Nocardiopsis sp. CNR-923]